VGRYDPTYKNHVDTEAHAAEKARLKHAWAPPSPPPTMYTCAVVGGKGYCEPAGAGKTGVSLSTCQASCHGNSPPAPPAPPAPGPPVNWLMTSTDFGATFTWAKMPEDLKTDGFVVDPTSANSLYTVGPSCLAHSTDNGKSWSPCSTAPGLTGHFSSLVVKDASTMFMFRTGAAPLRTKDGGKTWSALATAPPLFAYGATFSGSLSWSGKTLVLHGTDRSAIGRGAYGTAVWKSSDDGDSWTDETGDLVTISLGQGVWYETDFYMTSGGEGVMVKRNFE